MTADSLPEELARLLGPAVARETSSLRTRIRVKNAVFFRAGLAGEVVLPNGRTLQPVAVVTAAPGPVLSHAWCSCSPQVNHRRPCVHVGLLLFSQLPSEPNAGLTPGARFERSALFSAAAALSTDRASLRHEPSEEAGSFRVRTRDGKGRLVAELVVPDAADPRLSWLRPAYPPSVLARAPELPLALASRERLLEKLTRTEMEEQLLKKGMKTQRQALEESFPFRVARGAFLALPEGPLRVRRREGLVIEAAGDGLTIALALDRDVSGQLLRTSPGLFAAGGLSVMPGAATLSLRLSLGEGGELRLAPVLVPDGGRPRELAAIEEERFGEHWLVAGDRLISARPPGPLFPEEARSGQAGFSFGPEYVPSPEGVPLDRETVVPEEEVPRFLETHREALRSWPESLAPDSIRLGTVEPLTGDVTLHASLDEDGSLLLDVRYHTRGGEVPFLLIQRARRSGRRLLVRGNAFLDVSGEELSWMDDVPAETPVRLAPLLYFRLRSFLRGQVRLEGDGPGLSALAALEAGEAEVAAPEPSSLGISLYPYQELGYRWLWFLHRNGFGGLLCDDMGLGKTHQAMALLAAVLRGSPVGEKALVVCPASVLPHWEEKLLRHLPGVPVHVHHGASRSLPDGGGILVTSYGTLRNDAPLLAETRFAVLVLDEAQTLKNRDTATYRALSRLQAALAVGLTGTPVENGVDDLKALLDFVLPGYLPGETEFRRRFVEPIESGSEVAAARLARLVHPFVLRRTKEQVLPELPEKIVDRRLCSLTSEQRDLYREVLRRKGRPLLTRLEDARSEVPYLHVFAALSALKQVCNHPALLSGGALDGPEPRSGKWELFRELLDEALESGLKVAVFSQYTRMLDLVETYLDGRGIGFAGIRGDTRDRGAQLARFQRDRTCRVFLASLRASGLGVDLTAASVVVHYDRWWNQAREDQATDRVHRPGQTRGVQVLKLVTRGTLEERIDAIIERKRDLASRLVKEDDPGLSKLFSREELRELLSDV